MSEQNQPNNLGKTSDGVDIIDGLPVITNEMRVGVVDTSRYRTAHDGWFDVHCPADGEHPARTVMQNGERVATTFRGWDGEKRVAADEWAALQAKQAD